jgi:CheY-like chemotaxis protein
MAAQVTLGLDEAPSLAGRRALVADDDPAITWFFADLLRDEGATVEEALDGDVAYSRIVENVPDIVLADVRMPGMGGKLLTMTLRDDPVLRDVAVVLLSWKEDWLARAIEEGVGAAGFLPKHSTPEGALTCVRRVLAARAHLESRLGGIATVRGIIDAVTPHRLLRMVAAARPNARLTIQDATSLHEVQLRDGAPVTATRVSSDGRELRGARVLASMLALRTGRFVVATERGPAPAELDGTLAWQLTEALERLHGGPELPEPTATQSCLPPVCDENTEPMVPPEPTEPVHVTTLRIAMPRPRAKTAPPALQLLEQTEPILRFPPNVRRAPVVAVEAPVVVKRVPAKPTWGASLRTAMVLALIAAGLAVGVGMSDAPDHPTHGAHAATRPR